MAHSDPTKAFSKRSPCFGCTHPPPPVPPLQEVTSQEESFMPDISATSGKGLQRFSKFLHLPVATGPIEYDLKLEFFPRVTHGERLSHLSHV